MAPAELMMGRKLRTQLDLLHPDTSRAVQKSQYRQRLAHDRRAKPKLFAIGDTVYARNYTKGPSWLPGTVVEREGEAVLGVRLSDGRVIRRHEEQLRHRTSVQAVNDQKPQQAILVTLHWGCSAG